MKIVKEFIVRKIAGEHVLVPTGSTAEEFNGMMTMTETAALIWENLEKVDSLEEMIDLVMQEYEVDQETAERDVTALVNELVRIGFIQYTKEDGTW